MYKEPKKCYVRSLQTTEELMETCRRLNLKFCYPENLPDQQLAEILGCSFSDPEDSDQEFEGYDENMQAIWSKSTPDPQQERIPYEVESILNDTQKNGEKFYLIKWKNRESKYNSLVPRSQLSGWEEKIEYYEAVKNRSTIMLSKKIVKYFLADVNNFRPFDFVIMKRLYAFATKIREDRVETLNLNMMQLREKANKLLNLSHFMLRAKAQEILQLMRFWEVRKSLLTNLLEWEKTINVGRAYVKVENNVDFERAPDEFLFIQHSINATGISFTDEPDTSCDCESCYKTPFSCCPSLNNEQFPYKRRGLLSTVNLPVGNPIYECNEFCKCGSDCRNRLVQHGRMVDLSIFRTNNGCGWGLKTLTPLFEGMFVLEYLGEIIKFDDSIDREATYDELGESCLFDLLVGEEYLYTIDSHRVGNCSHFINHSCDPNLTVFTVWMSNRTPPRLAFFANKDISSGVELTFDYRVMKSPGRPVVNRRIPCKCNAEECRKYIF